MLPVRNPTDFAIENVGGRKPGAEIELTWM